MYEIPRHESLNRRTMVQAGSIGLLGLGLNHVSALRQAHANPLSTTGGGRAKSIIFIFLSGGLTQHDSFDPKPNAPAGIRGEFSAIATRSPGIQICEHLPLLAERSQKWSLIRSLTTPFNGHRGLSALLDDLDERGLLDETMIVMCGAAFAIQLSIGRLECNARNGSDVTTCTFRRTDASRSAKGPWSGKGRGRK